MPLSKARNRERMRIEMRRVRALKREGGTVLLPSATVRRLRRQGLTITRALVMPKPTLEDYRDLERRQEAKAARVKWQSGGIRMLREQIATMEARVAVLQQRVTLLEAEHVVVLTLKGHEEYPFEKEGWEAVRPSLPGAPINRGADRGTRRPRA